MNQTVDFTINFNDIIIRVKHQLSLIGKRAKNNDGTSLFSYVTLSSAEEVTLRGYIKSAMEKVVASIRGFVTKAAYADDSMQLTVTNTRWKLDTDPSPFADSFTESVTGYLTSFTIAEFLLPNFSQLAQKFVADASMHMDSLTSLMYFKLPPEKSTDDYSSISGTISIS